MHRLGRDWELWSPPCELISTIFRLRHWPRYPLVAREVPTAPVGVRTCRRVHRHIGEQFGSRVHMKNTGKRIFFSVVAFTVANLAVLVVAGSLTSQR